MVGSPPPKVRLPTRRNSSARRRSENAVMAGQNQYRLVRRCYDRIMRGRWFVISASVALVALVAAAVTILYRAAPKKTARAAPVAPAPPPADINLSGKIRPQQ